MASRKKIEGDGVDRRVFLRAAAAAAAGGLVARGVTAGRTVLAAGATPFAVELMVEGGLLALNKTSKVVELAFPGATTGKCKSPAHPMQLEITKDAKVVKATGGLSDKAPWQLNGYSVRVEVPGSATKPDPAQWRLAPAAPHPKTEAEFAWLDWIPSIDGVRADDWDKRVSTRLVFATGDWNAEQPRNGYDQELWKLLDAQGNVIRSQYVTDTAKWKDRSDGGPVILHFDKNGKEVGSITIEPSAPGSTIALAVTTPATTGEVIKGQKVKHYCMHYSLLKGVRKPFEILRTGEKFKVRTSLDKIPGKFCPGAKIVVA